MVAVVGQPPGPGRPVDAGSVKAMAMVSVGSVGEPAMLHPSQSWHARSGWWIAGPGPALREGTSVEPGQRRIVRCVAQRVEVDQPVRCVDLPIGSQTASATH